jgi:hypothetical protein
MGDRNIAAAEPFVREPRAGSTLDVLGLTYIYKPTAAETGGSFSRTEVGPRSQTFTCRPGVARLRRLEHYPAQQGIKI